jgi:hypothetical protein
MDEYLRFLSEFEDAMSLKYDQHREEKGDSWKDCDLPFLYKKLKEEVAEALALPPDVPGHSMGELEDVGLVAAMIWMREKGNLFKKFESIAEKHNV